MPRNGSNLERRTDDGIARLACAQANEPDAGDVTALIAEAIASSLRPLALGLFRTNEAGDALRLVQHRGLPLEAAERLQTVPISEAGLVGRAARQRDVMLMDRTAQKPEIAPDAMSDAYPAARIAVALPCVFRGRLLGAMEVVLDRDEPVSPAARTHLATLGHFIGVVLAEALSRESVHASISHTERAHSAAEAVLEALSFLPEQQLQTAVRRGFYLWPQHLEATVPEFITGVLQHVVDEARELVGAEIAAVGIGDLPDRPFAPWAFSGVPDSTLATVGRTPRPIGTLGIVACRGETVRVADVRKHPSFRGLPPGHPPVTSMLGVPIRYRGQSLGNLYLANKIGAAEFTPQDERAAEALAHQAAIALQQGFLLASIEAQRAQTQSLLDSAPHGILFVDSSTRRVMANPSAMRLLGETVTPDGGIEQYIDRLRYPDGRPVPIEATTTFRALRGEEHPTEHFVIHRRDGIEVPILSSAASVRGFGRKVLGVVENFQDVSTVRDLERMQNLEHVREEFNATIAHDLRNPIQTVLAQIYLLLRRVEGDEVKVPVKALRRIERSATALGRMAGVLLDVSRIELKQVELRREPAYMPDVVSDLLDRMRPALAADGHDVELSIADHPPSVALDSFAFEHLVTNLIDNAAKFSPKGAPIRVTVQSSDGGVLLSVRDQGPGISPEDKAHLFDRFYRAGETRGKTMGLGLGLFIVKGYVEAHGGRISVESEQGHGSTFVVWFPPVSPEQAMSPPPAHA